MNVAIIHLFYPELVDEVLNKTLELPVEKIIATTCDLSIVEKVKKQNIKNLDISLVPNKGMDIGPFLLSLDKVPQNCQYIYKLHTKKNDKWRSELFDGLPLNPNSKVIYGTQKWVYKDHQYYKKDKILKLCIKLGFRYPNIVFLAGTVFCIKKDILYKWFFEKRFEIYELLEEGFTSDKKNSTWTHALERVLSSLCYLEKDTLWDLSIPKNYNGKNIFINYGFDESKLPNIKKNKSIIVTKNLFEIEHFENHLVFTYIENQNSLNELIENYNKTKFINVNIFINLNIDSRVLKSQNNIFIDNKILYISRFDNFENTLEYIINHKKNRFNTFLQKTYQIIDLYKFIFRKNFINNKLFHNSIKYRNLKSKLNNSQLTKSLPIDFKWLNYVLLNTDIFIHTIHSKAIVTNQFLTNGILGKRIYLKIEDFKVDKIHVIEPIYLFQHIYAQNDWEQIFEEQITLIKQSGLWDNIDKIFINVSGNKSDVDKISSLVPYSKVSIRLIDENFEYPTLNQIKTICETTNFKGVYIHTKSTSYSINHPDKWKFQFWRKIMEFQIIHHWKSCYNLIASHDLVGTLFIPGNTKTEDYWNHFSALETKELKYTDHFSGNFFWFDSNYFSTLPVLTETQKKNRFNAEWYPFFNHPKYFNLFNDFDYWIEQLKKKIQGYDFQYYKKNHDKFSIIKNHNIGKFEVSVIISLYNYQNHVKKAVSSVMFDVTKPLTEIVIINDCSTDASLEAAQSFLNTEHHVTLINKFHNTGLADTRNIGINNCSGNYVFILDADNEIYINCLKSHYDFLANNNSHMACYAAIECFDSEMNLVRQISNRAFDLQLLKKGNYIDAMAMFNKTKLIEIGLYDVEMLQHGIGWEDFELWLRIGNKGEQVGFIDKPLSRYLIKTDSMLSLTEKKSNKKKLKNYLNKKHNANIQ